MFNFISRILGSPAARNTVTETVEKAATHVKARKTNETLTSFDQAGRSTSAKINAAHKQRHRTSTPLKNYQSSPENFERPQSAPNSPLFQRTDRHRSPVARNHGRAYLDLDGKDDQSFENKRRNTHEIKIPLSAKLEALGINTSQGDTHTKSSDTFSNLGAEDSGASRDNQPVGTPLQFENNPIPPQRSQSLNDLAASQKPHHGSHWSIRSAPAYLDSLDNLELEQPEQDANEKKG